MANFSRTLNVTLGIVVLKESPYPSSTCEKCSHPIAKVTYINPSSSCEGGLPYMEKKNTHTHRRRVLFVVEIKFLAKLSTRIKYKSGSNPDLYFTQRE